MDNKRFRLWNLLTGCAVFLIATVTYLSTIEPTASFWDCGEFIASSYKLEVGHPPGNPVFQLIARAFTMFTGPDKAAVMVNAMSGLCSSLTIFFLYLTIVFFAKRLVVRKMEGEEDAPAYSLSQAIAIIGSGAVGALAYTFTDTFWFSAVEGEVYAMSSLFTAIVVWAMTRWYEAPDRRYANRWIILISFLMGLSIGVHLLNLLAIPMLVFMYYYRMREDKPFSLWELVRIMLVSVVILALVVFILVPYLPKVAAYVDLFFVNVLSLPYNTGAAFFLTAVLGACFWGLFKTLDKGKVFLNTALLCFTTIVIGFSLFTVVIIRSSAKTPTNEYQPDNAFTLVRYLSREQYGTVPLLYGQYFGSPYELEPSHYWAPVDGKYKKVEGPVDVKFDAAGKMIFPRMHSTDEKHVKFYQYYMDGKGIPVAGTDEAKPTFGANLRFFFDFQLGWMYWRYFMWNFAGRQNDIHAPSQDPFVGNWECGIRPLDELRLGNQDNAPDWLKHNKGKNHYFLLPLLLGLLGLIFQLDKDNRGCWLTFLLFFMTGIAIVIYLNQPPFQVRERDYAYAGSFYAFSIWIGLGVAALAGWVNEKLGSGTARVGGSLAVSLLCMGVPVLMACQNWDDHDRSNRYTAVEIARNYLNSVGENGILVTHGDNDTFPLWYAQEVENVRTDVRICNTSLLGTDWYIDQMKYACNKSAPLKLSVGPEQYLYGTNELVYIYDKRDTVVPLKDVMAVFRSPKAKLTLSDGSKVNYICSKRFSIPVNKENCLKYGIVPEKYADRIPDSIILTLKGRYLSKPELFMLDLLSNYEWDRPINMLSMGGEIEVGMKEYLLYDGFSFRFVPIKNSTKSTDIGLSDPDDLYHKMTEVFTWDALKRTDWLVDYQNYYTFCGVMSQRLLFVNAAKEMLKVGDKARALELLNRCQECVPRENFPLDMSWMGFSNELMVLEMISLYYYSGDADSARALAADFSEELISASVFYAEFYDYCKREFDSERMVIASLVDMLMEEGDGELAKNIESSFKLALGVEDR